LLTTSVVKNQIATLLQEHEAPCISLYMPTHRRHPENQQDPILFKNLMKKLQEPLESGHWPASALELLRPYQDLGGDTAFWNHAWDGLAVFACRGYFEVIRLQRPVPVRAIVAGSFHIKPLLRILQSAERYQLLALSRKQVKLYEGTIDQLDEVPLANGVPRSIPDALGTELTEPHRTVASYGGVRQGSAMHHSHGGRKDELAVDDERYFRAVDRAIAEHHSRPSGLPLILAALAEHQAEFRRVSHNAALLAGGVDIDPSAMSAKDLCERARKVTEMQYRERAHALSEAYGNAVANGSGSDDLQSLARAGATSRINTLLLEAGRYLPGHVDLQTGDVFTENVRASETDDVFDEIGEMVIKRGGEVFVLPPADMPVSTGVAGIFRY
jgi:hypothetical protein